jgi:predicted extracellular nuclease
MKIRTIALVVLAVAGSASVFVAAPARAAASRTVLNTDIQITEYMYDSTFATIKVEYIEITNTGAGNINLSGWSFDDDSFTPGSFSLSGLGTLAPGQSAIITEDSASAFRARWGLPGATKVAGGNTHNIGRSDVINIYDNNNVLVDTLSYNDQACGPRAKGKGATVAPANLGNTSTCPDWFLPVSGLLTSTDGDQGTPGSY